MERFDLIVIGAGATGLAAARSARRGNRSVALVEAARPGGDCTHHGCVPSKTLLEVARRVQGARSGSRFGFSASVEVDFAAVMARVADVIATIELDESPARLRSEGIDLFKGWARFTDPSTVDVDGRVLAARRFVIATGASAVTPPIDGLSDVGFLDNRSVFELRDAPEHLLVMGGGNIGVELAQAFRRLGSAVTVVEALPRLLAREEPRTSRVVTDVLTAEGVDVRTGAKVERVSAGPTLHLAGGGTVAGTHLLVAVGRRPATDGMNLDVAGVDVGDKSEIVADAHLRTSAEHIFTAGDCTSPLQFTHVGDEQGRIAAANAFASGAMGGRLPAVAGGLRRWDPGVVPWVTFTEPEVGRVGLTEAEAYAAHGSDARVAEVDLVELDRPRTAGETAGYVKLIAVPRRIVNSRYAARIGGMTAVSPAGGELVAEAALAMQTGMLAARLAQTIHAYPTYSLGTRIAAARLFGEHAGKRARPARPDAG